MKVLGILGSPRVTGASARVLDIALAKVKEAGPGIDVERLDLTKYHLESCTGCDICLKTNCPLDEKDDYPTIHAKLVEADGIIIASPVYFFNMPGLLKTLIDRSRRMKMNRNELKNKVFASIVSSGLRNGGGEVVSILLISWALSQGMIPVAGLGHPVIENPLAITTLQKDGLKEFRGPTDEDQIGDKVAGSIGSRVVEIINLVKK